MPTRLSVKQNAQCTARSPLPYLPRQGAESLRGKDTEGPHSSGRRHPSSSFVDRVMVALTVEEEDRNTSPAEATGTRIRFQYGGGATGHVRLFIGTRSV